MIRNIGSSRYHQIYLPEVEVVNRTLLISHVYVEGEKIYRRLRPSIENFIERRQPIPI